MRVAVVGAGAVGGYFGGRLAEAGVDVAFLARGEHLSAIRRDGLRVTSIAGDFTVRPAVVSDNPADVGPVDVVLLGVKAWQIPQAARTISPLIGTDTFVVPLENGIEAPEVLSSAVGEQHVVGGLCRILGFITGPGQVRHAGIEPYVAFGELNGTRSSRVNSLLQLFGRARGVRAEIPDDIHVAMWSKFLLIAAWSALGAMTRAPIGVIRSMPETRRLMYQSLREIYTVAAAEGIALPVDSAEKTMSYIDALPADGTSSMQRDVLAGRPSELDAQVGAVVRLGERSGVDVQLHRFIYAALLPLERRARGELAFPA